MSYPFSGILVRYLPVSKDTCGCDLRSSTTEKEKESSPEEQALPHEASLVLDFDYKKPQDEPDLSNTYLPDELHVNLWEIGKNSDEPFMDIGVMIGDRERVGYLVLDVPWTVEQKDISDLGARLNGEKSVAAIFNEVVHYDGFAEGNFANISFRKSDDDEKPFSLLRLNSQHFVIEKFFVGDGMPASRITISIPRIPETVRDKNRRKSCYVRFRVRKIPRKVYTEAFDQKDRALISSTIATRIVDFRINVRRGIPEALLSGDDKIYFPKFSKIHCFLTTERTEQCISHSHSYAGYRSLMDEDVWNEYVRLDVAKGISAENSVKNYLGYQWTAIAKEVDDESGSSTEGTTKKKIKYVKDLIVLGRFSKVKSDLFSIFTFVLLVICFGALGSGLWEFVKERGNDLVTHNRLGLFVLFAFGIFSLGFLFKTIRACFKKVSAYVERLRDR